MEWKYPLHFTPSERPGLATIRNGVKIFGFYFMFFDERKVTKIEMSIWSVNIHSISQKKMNPHDDFESLHLTTAPFRVYIYTKWMIFT